MHPYGLILGLYFCAVSFLTLPAADLDKPFSRSLPKIFPASDEAEKAIQTFRPAKGLSVDLFAAEPLLANPVAFCFDEQGRVYVAETFRRGTGVLDVETRVTWEDPAIVQALGRETVADYLLDEELANKTVEDSIAVLKRHLGARAADLSGISERLQLIIPGRTGKAERSLVFAEGFDRIGEGLASGVLARQGKIWFACIPNLWQLRGTPGADSAGERKILQHGYGVRVGSGAHALHALRIGPDGKLYFSIGDRGANVRAWDGSQVANPEYGAVYRCNLDGSDLELYAIGLRNPQGLAFDKFGNLFTGDNNSDAGDPSRWVYVVEGGDSGWRVGYQFLERPIDAETLTHSPQPRGAWLNERQCYPSFDGQAAFLVPPVGTIANGPSGLTYYPGVGLPEKYDNHFFLCDFKGSAANSLIHSLAVKPQGAGFELADRDVLISNVLPTDVQFGPDCRIYWCDWVNGWPPPGKGRLYRLSDEQLASSPLAVQTRNLIAGGMDRRSLNELAKLLSHPDQRVRQEAQFALAKAGAIPTLRTVARENQNQIARLHAIWALGQIADPKASTGPNQKSAAVKALLPLLADHDSEAGAQAAKVLGDARAEPACQSLLQLLADSANPRGQFFAALGLGKIGKKDAIPAILEMLRNNRDRDPFLRHAGVMALVWIKDLNSISAAGKDESASVRMASLLALRRLEQPEAAGFLRDSDPKIVAEAARAINDASLYSALPELAELIEGTTWAAFPNGADGKTDLLTPLLRRVINANFRIGAPQNAAALARFAARTDAPEEARFEALQQIGHWEKPSARDQITGLYRPLPARDARAAAAALRPVLPEILAQGPASIRLTAAKLAEQYGIREAAPGLFAMVLDKKAADFLRAAGLQALAAVDEPKFAEAIKAAETDSSESVRIAAARLRARTQPAGTADQFVALLENGSPAERQNALTTLGTLPGGEADEILAHWLDKLLAGNLRPEFQLDLLEAAGKRTSPLIKTKLERYEALLPKADDLAHYRSALYGGRASEGQKLFFDRPEASCVRCHRIGETGNDVGSALTGIGARRSREYILESIVYPNKQIAPGFETVIVLLKDGSSLAGIVKSEDSQEVVLNSPDAGLTKIKKADIQKRERGLSGMPEGFGEILSKRDLRDLVEFLASQTTTSESR